MAKTPGRIRRSELNRSHDGRFWELLSGGRRGRIINNWLPWFVISAECGFTAAPNFEPPAYKPILLRPDSVWSAGHSAPRKGWAVLVTGEQIAAVGPQINAGDAEVIERPGTTLLPGLMDLHSHLLLYLL